jgi:hypothetical protein
MPTGASIGGAFDPNADYTFTGTITGGTFTGPSIVGGSSSSKENQVTISGDGAITIARSTVLLTKGSAAAITLAAPTAAQAGTTIVIVAQSAFAHVVTATGLIDDGTTGGSKNTWTSAAFVGSAITLQAINLKWTVVSKNLGTVA